MLSLLLLPQLQHTVEEQQMIKRGKEEDYKSSKKQHGPSKEGWLTSTLATVELGSLVKSMDPVAKSGCTLLREEVMPILLPILLVAVPR